MAPHARLVGLAVLLVVLTGCGGGQTAAGSPPLPTAAGTLSPAGATALAATRAATTATVVTTLTVVTTPPAGTATPTPASAAALACTGFVGATFAGAPYTSTLGLPQPAQVYTPTVTFTPNTYTAIGGDIVEEYTYTCAQGTIMFGRTTTPRGTYDPATDTLIWGTPPYTQPYHRLP